MVLSWSLKREFSYPNWMQSVSLTAVLRAAAHHLSFVLTLWTPPWCFLSSLHILVTNRGLRMAAEKHQSVRDPKIQKKSTLRYIWTLFGKYCTAASGWGVRVKLLSVVISLKKCAWCVSGHWITQLLIAAQDEVSNQISGLFSTRSL